MGKDETAMKATRVYEKGVSKIPLERVDASELAIYTNQVIQNGEVVQQGDAHFIHEDEWVELVPTRTMEEYLSLAELASATSIKNDAESGMALARSLGALSEALAKRVVHWNWTDVMGVPMDQPFGRPDLIRSLHNEELLWLVGAAQGETPDQRGNGSTPSQGTSSTRRAKSPSPARAS